MIPLTSLLQPSGLHCAEIIKIITAAVLISVPARNRCSLLTEAIGNIIVIRCPHICLFLACDVKIIKLVIHGDPSGGHVSVAVEVVVVSVNCIPGRDRTLTFFRRVVPAVDIDIPPGSIPFIDRGTGPVLRYRILYIQVSAKSEQTDKDRHHSEKTDQCLKFSCLQSQFSALCFIQY